MSFCDVEYKFKKIGDNVQIGKNVYFRYPELIEIGNNVIIDEFCFFSTALIIEDYVHIAPFCSVIGGKESKLIMKEFSGLSSGCRIICGSDEYNGEGLTNPTVPLKYRKKAKYSTIEIHSHAVLGTNCVIHPDVIIGEGAAIGSCSLVNKSLEPWNIFVGVPCRKLKERQKENILLLAKKLKSEEIDGSNS